MRPAFSRLLCVFAAGAVVAGCSGGGAGVGGRGIVPAVPAAGRAAAGKAVFTIRVPVKKKASAIKPAYVSPATNSVSFQIAPAAAQVISLALGSASCPLGNGFYTCSLTFNAPIGTGTMVVKTFASTDGSGPALSMNSVPVSIVQGQPNPITVTLNGVVAALTLSITPNSVAVGQPSTLVAAWGGTDASNNTIVGPGSMVDVNGNPIAPTLASSSSDFVVSGSQPSWNVAYDGTASSTTFTLAASGFTSVTQTLTALTNVDWDGFGYDLQRTGYNPNESAVGVANIGTVHKLWSTNVGSPMVGEPVVAAGVPVAGQPINVLYAGSGGSYFYAINASTGATIWKVPMVPSSYSCDGGSSNFGVEGTPAIDRATSRIYLADGQNNVHALDLATGTEAQGWPINIADVTPDHNFVYGGLTFNPSNQTLYVGTSSTCDIVPYTGRLTAINTTTAGIVNTFYPAQQPNLGGGVWGLGGASIDPTTNNVFIAVGNSTGSSQTTGFSEQVVELNANLSTVIAHNLPTLPASSDADFGATPLLFQPPGCPPLAAAVNKSGVFVLYNRSNIGAGPTQEIAMSIPSDNGDFIGVPAYDPVTQFVYVGLPSTYGIYTPGIGAFRMQGCTLNPAPVWSQTFGPDGAIVNTDVPRSAITIANGVVYISDWSADTEFAFNAATGTQLWTTALTSYGFPGTVVADGIVYVSDIAGNVTAWGP